MHYLEIIETGCLFLSYIPSCNLILYLWEHALAWSSLIPRGSFRKIVKRGQKLMLKKLGGGGGITSLVPTLCTMFTCSKEGRERFW